MGTEVLTEKGIERFGGQGQNSGYSFVRGGVEVVLSVHICNIFLLYYISFLLSFFFFKFFINEIILHY